MTLTELKTALQVTTGTSISEVIFDWDEYLKTSRKISYPAVLWELGGVKFKKDGRTRPVQPSKTITLKVFGMQLYDYKSQDKITVWDEIEGFLDVYLNAVDASAKISIENINELQGTYYGQGAKDPEREIGVSYEVTLKMFC
jgi:hypothetical protein